MFLVGLDLFYKMSRLFLSQITFKNYLCVQIRQIKFSIRLFQCANVKLSSIFCSQMSVVEIVMRQNKHNFLVLRPKIEDRLF